MKNNFISIINEGANITNNNFVYIGRPSKFQNPFPTKPSKFSTLKYSHEESMKMFFKYFEKEIITNQDLIKNINTMLNNNFNITLSCFCIHRKFTLSDFENFNLLNVTCHGEIISYFIFKHFLL